MQPSHGRERDYFVYRAIDDWALRTKKGAADTGSALIESAMVLSQAGSTTTFVLTGVWL